MFLGRTYRERRSIHSGYPSFPIDLDDISFLEYLTTRPGSALILPKHNPITLLKAPYTLSNICNLAKALVAGNVQGALLSANTQLPRSGLVGVHALNGVYIRGINGRQEMLNGNR